MSTGTQKITSLLNENHIPEYNRSNIIKIATNFLKKLYSLEESINRVNSIYNLEENVPEFLKKEIEIIIKQLKPDKTPGIDNIKK